jgi:hypothetical protein
MPEVPPRAVLAAIGINGLNGCLLAFSIPACSQGNPGSGTGSSAGTTAEPGNITRAPKEAPKALDRGNTILRPF